ncbi:MAG: cyclic nucleotide-binding domain-containing protein [Deltaproteobacteria bacterium]|nr:cyclic nucleotide-binding domain-containing protein [Deltaproteobacteria bacterium]
MSEWTDKDTKEFIENLELFSDLRAEDRTALVGKARLRSYSPNELILQRGEAGSSLFIIARGKARITLEGPKGHQDVSILEAGDFFGEIAMLTRAHRTATVTAVGETVLLELGSRDVLALAEKNADFEKRIARTGARRSRESLSKLIDD